MNVKLIYKTEWPAWWNAKQRCCNKNHPLYKWYGERGISMCDEWKNSFSNFINHMGKKPDKKLTLDRINNSLGYQPGNCRWVTMKVQCNNRRTENVVRIGLTPKVYEVSGIKKTVREWSNFIGEDISNIRHLVCDKKMSYEDAIKIRLNKKKISLV